jgi:hypothetical protein
MEKKHKKKPNKQTKQKKKNNSEFTKMSLHQISGTNVVKMRQSGYSMKYHGSA